MSERNKRRMVHHEVIRAPNGWREQDKALIIQLNRVLDDIYNRLGLLAEAQKESESGGNTNANP